MARKKKKWNHKFGIDGAYGSGKLAEMTGYKEGRIATEMLIVTGEVWAKKTGPNKASRWIVDARSVQTYLERFEFNCVNEVV